MSDLWQELQRACAHPHVDEVMAEFGVTSETRLLCGAACIEAHGNRFYEPVQDGKPAIILPIFDSDELVDLLAFDPREPERWLLRLGGEPLLGRYALSDQLLGKPLHVYRTPLSWLKAGCDGVVILDPIRSYIDLATAQYGVAGENDAHTNELRRTLTETALHRLPRFLVRDEVVT